MTSEESPGQEPPSVRRATDGLAWRPQADPQPGPDAAEPGPQPPLLQDAPGAPAPAGVRAIDITHGRALVRLTGADAARLLAKVCAIDLRKSKTPNGAAFRSSVAKLVTDVVRDDIEVQGQVLRSYLLHCERSSGQYFYDALLDAGREFGIEAAGFGDR